MRRLEKQTFSYCEHLAQIKLNEGLEEIGEGCFWYSGLMVVQIPASVRLVEKEAFYGCERLGEVEFASGSRLERVESRAFLETGVRSLGVSEAVDVAADAFEGGQ